MLTYLYLDLKLHFDPVFGCPQHIEEWLSSGQGHERERAMNTTAHILEFYFNNLHVKVSQNFCKPFFLR